MVAVVVQAVHNSSHVFSYNNNNIYPYTIGGLPQVRKNILKFLNKIYQYSLIL